MLCGSFPYQNRIGGFGGRKCDVYRICQLRMIHVQWTAVKLAMIMRDGGKGSVMIPCHTPACIKAPSIRSSLEREGEHPDLGSQALDRAAEACFIIDEQVRDPYTVLQFYPELEIR